MTAPPVPVLPPPPPRPRSAATGSTVRALTSMAWNPPAAAGRRAAASRTVPPRAAARTAHGSPAYPNSSAHCPMSRRWAR
ncbi:hypothetical protein [Microbispora sp. GKU 823]|uniref:hypothetical protein n=1 Tax=Microbispora sp. GKU 823 TaxID=1652100 RepID=UPI0015C48398|nr:hypothetical protein [Microbispora sp. GKU 823]